MAMEGRAVGRIGLVLGLAAHLGHRQAPASGPPPLTELRLVTPSLVELRLEGPPEALPAVAPGAGQVEASVDGRAVAVLRSGWRRRVASAPLRPPALRVTASLLFELAEPMPPGAVLELGCPVACGPCA